MFYLEDKRGGDADDEEEGGHDEVRHRHPEPRRVVDARPRPARVVYEYHHLRTQSEFEPSCPNPEGVGGTVGWAG